MFTVKISYNGKTIDFKKFNSYLEAKEEVEKLTRVFGTEWKFYYE